MTHVLALDQGTTSSRAILFDADGRAVASAQREFAQAEVHVCDFCIIRHKGIVGAGTCSGA